MESHELIQHVSANFSRIYLGSIPSLLSDGGAYLSFICVLTAIEALGGFLAPKAKNGARFKAFVEKYFPGPLSNQANDLWTLRNAAIHGFSTGPYALTHHNSHLHLTEDRGRILLNAEDFYAAPVIASERFLDRGREDPALQEAFQERAKDRRTGLLVVGPFEGVS
ncbi:MAG: hypothetical protein P8020_21905 [Acidobacteriota bacterium]|jgi:hypothetical protein